MATDNDPTDGSPQAGQATLAASADQAITRDEALRLLEEHRDELGRFHVTSLGLFGSVARDEAHPGSDVDILVEFDPSARVGIFKFLELQEHLEDVLGRRVDLIMRDALKPQIRDEVLAETIRVA